MSNNKNTIELAFWSDTKEKELLYELKEELVKKSFLVAIKESDEEKEMPPPGVGADIPEFIKWIFLPATKLCIYIPLSLIFAGFFGEIGADGWRKLKQVIKSNKKEYKKKEKESRGVVIRLFKEGEGEGEIKEHKQEWFFFLDGIGDDDIDNSLNRIKETFVDISKKLGEDYLKTVWKIGFVFNGEKKQWEIADIQEYPYWMTEENKGTIQDGRYIENKGQIQDSLDVNDKKDLSTSDIQIQIKDLTSQLLSLQEEFSLLDDNEKFSIKNIFNPIRDFKMIKKTISRFSIKFPLFSSLLLALIIIFKWLLVISVLLTLGYSLT